MPEEAPGQNDNVKKGIGLQWRPLVYSDLPTFATVKKIGHFRSLHDAQVHSPLSCINEYLAIGSGGNMNK